MKAWSIGGTLVSLSHAMKILISIYELVLIYNLTNEAEESAKVRVPILSLG